MPQRFLYLDIAAVEPDRATSSVRSAQIVALAVARGMDVDVATLHPPLRPGHEATVRGLGATPLPWCDEAARRAFLAEHARGYDAIAFAFSNVARRFIVAARQASPHTVLLYDTHDVNHLREYREARTTGNRNTMRRALATRAHEAAAIRAADVTIAITEADAAVFRALVPEARVAVVSLWREPAAAAEFPGTPTLLFVGHYGASFNCDAAVLLAREILPRIRKHRSETRLVLAGSDPPDEIAVLAGLQIAVPGWQPDLAPQFAAAGIFVAPLRFGSGLKGKMLQAMAHGLPIVASAVAAEGMPLRDGVDYLAADTVEATAAAAVRLLEDEALARRLGESARQVLAAHYGRAAVARQFAAALDMARAAGAGGVAAFRNLEPD